MWWWRKVQTLTPFEGYNLWAKSYHQEANPIKSLSDDYILASISNIRDLAVLDAGCGTGKICVAAEQRSAAIIHGIDLSPAMIEQSRKNCPKGSFQCADLSKLNIDEPLYDVVVCGLVLGHIDELRKPLTTLIRSLKPGGRIILTDFHPYQSLSDAKRTFKDEKGKTYEVSHTCHMLGEYFEILRNKNVDIIDVKEPLYKNAPAIFGITGVKSK
jgi:malonyl-CoA O-methyltransferase